MRTFRLLFTLLLVFGGTLLSCSKDDDNTEDNTEETTTPEENSATVIINGEEKEINLDEAEYTFDKKFGDLYAYTLSFTSSSGDIIYFKVISSSPDGVESGTYTYSNSGNYSTGVGFEDNTFYDAGYSSGSGDIIYFSNNTENSTLLKSVVTKGTEKTDLINSVLEISKTSYGYDLQFNTADEATQIDISIVGELAENSSNFISINGTEYAIKEAIIEKGAEYTTTCILNLHLTTSGIDISSIDNSTYNASEADTAFHFILPIVSSEFNTIPIGDYTYSTSNEIFNIINGSIYVYGKTNPTDENQYNYIDASSTLKVIRNEGSYIIESEGSANVYPLQNKYPQIDFNISLNMPIEIQ